MRRNLVERNGNLIEMKGQEKKKQESKKGRK